MGPIPSLSASASKTIRQGMATTQQLMVAKMTVWQPLTWMAKSEEPSPRNFKVWMSQRMHFRPLFPKLAKNYSCYE